MTTPLVLTDRLVTRTFGDELERRPTIVLPMSWSSPHGALSPLNNHFSLLPSHGP
jgi:hypothetical protein